MENRLCILFVDDEVRILEGLQRLLRPMRTKWEILIAANAHDTLEILARQMVDVVVSDMRMPGMDGAALLAEVRQRHPGTMRIMLSGQSERESDLCLIGPVQQFLKKPCELSDLHATIDRAMVIRTLVNDENIRHYVDACLQVFQLNDQPLLRVGLPFAEVLLKDPEAIVGASTLTRAFRDVAWMASRATAIAGWQQACEIFGEAGAAALLLCEHLLSICSLNAECGLQTSGWRQHGRQVAVLARDIALTEAVQIEVVGASFIAGLLHDTGSLLFAARAPADYPALLSPTHPPEGIETSERGVLLGSHAHVSAALAFQWGFPHWVAEAVAFHRLPGGGNCAKFTPLTAVHVAAALLAVPAREASPGDSGSVSEAYLARLGLAHRLEAWTRLADRVRQRPDP